MKEYTVQISDEEDKALHVAIVDPQKWIQNAISAKARRVTNRIILAVSDKNPAKISVEEKATIIRDANLETAAERNARMEAELSDK